ncbi:MAG: dioxygenase [Eggerthellaceae bacterium]|nr:dioxygenase [Eggerthellaceae bacterium]
MVVAPEEIQAAPGIQVFGRVIRSFIYSTDIVAIRNSNADAVLAVYPFTCQPAITQALLIAAECPVFTGVAGATTHGDRSVDVALQSEMQGVTGVIANSTADAETISAIAARVDIPVVVTITAFNEPDKHRIRAGASIVNVAAGRNTAAVVAAVRADFPDIPIMASGGKTARSISATIAAGADAISFTPPSIADLQHTIMSKNRELQSSSSLDVHS